MDSLDNIIIWSFGAGGGCRPPSFVGTDFFCEHGDNRAIWDGGDCTSTTDDCNYNPSQWFSVSIPSTSDDIEVRLCTDSALSDEAVHIGFLQFFVQ